MKHLADIEYDSIVHETEKAVQFSIGGKKVWLPKSVIEIDEDNKTVVMPEQLAIDKELV